MLFVVVERRAADPLLDLSLFRKPAFTGVTIVGFALSASIFSMFLYITLFFQNVLGFSPFEAGLRSLPVTMPILFVSPLSGRLTARVPVRLLLGTGLAFVTVGLLLMGEPVRLVRMDRAAARPDPGRHRDRPGHPRAGLDRRRRGPPQLSGMASGASNTARQLGLATGIAGLGSIFQHRLAVDGFVAGLNRIFLVAGLLALAGAALTLVLLRAGDFDPSGT